MKYLLILLLTGCNHIPYYKVDTNQPDWVIPHTVIDMPLKRNEVNEMCKGSRACIHLDSGFAVLIYKEGDECGLLHEEEHLSFGRRHTAETETCKEILRRYNLK